MGRGVECNIFSVYKEYFGIENGNLLQATQNDKIAFDGTDNLPSTSFVKTNNGKRSTFHMVRDDINYYITEDNESISLKEGPETFFKVKRILRSQPFVSIQSATSDLYLTTDEHGRLKMESTEVNSNLKAWFRIEGVWTDSTDGVGELRSRETSSLLPAMFDLNMNNRIIFCWNSEKKNVTFDDEALLQGEDSYIKMIIYNILLYLLYFVLKR